MNLRLMFSWSVLGIIGFAIAMTGRQPPVAAITPVAGERPETRPVDTPRVSTSTSQSALSSSTTTGDWSELPDNVAELKSSLESLHTLSVRSFESMPMFGANRARLYTPSYSSMRLPAKHLPEFSEVRGDWRADTYLRVRDDGNKNVIKGYEAWSWLYAMQRITRRGLVYQQSDLKLGWKDRDQAPTDKTHVVGMPTESGRIDLDKGYLKLDGASPLDPNDRLWEMQHMQLVSLLEHDPPVAYVMNPPDTFQREVRVSTRDLDDIEQAILQRLQAGEDLVTTWDEREHRATMMGAIRAKDSCIKCHKSMKQDDLLGAFTYRLSEPVVDR